MPYLYTDADGYALGQWQESGRDQGHTSMGMSQMGALCEMARSQGDGLHSYDDRRFKKAAQYVAPESDRPGTHRPGVARTALPRARAAGIPGALVVL